LIFAETASIDSMLHLSITGFFINIPIDLIQMRAAQIPNE